MQLSADGKAAAAKLQAEAEEAQAEAEGHKTDAGDPAEAADGGTLMSDAARAQLEKDIEKQQRDGERFEQDAQAELNELQQQLQTEFNRKLFPVLEKMCEGDRAADAVQRRRIRPDLGRAGSRPDDGSRQADGRGADAASRRRPRRPRRHRRAAPRRRDAAASDRHRERVRLGHAPDP